MEVGVEDGFFDGLLYGVLVGVLDGVLDGFFDSFFDGFFDGLDVSALCGTLEGCDDFAGLSVWRFLQIVSKFDSYLVFQAYQFLSKPQLTTKIFSPHSIV